MQQFDLPDALRQLTAVGDIQAWRQIGGATLILGDCLKVLPWLNLFDAVVTDPPYGIGYKINARGPRETLGGGIGKTATAARGAIIGDDRPFDPQPWLGPRTAFFGADHFAPALPATGSWMVWDKRRDSNPDCHSDAELIWLSVPGATRIHRQLWRGICREGEENCARSPKLHPNQKPVALLTKIMTRLKLRPGQLVVDPYMGSGSTGVVAGRLGLRFLGIEIDAGHFETACHRLRSTSVTESAA